MDSVFESLIQNIPAIFYRCKCDESWTMLFLNKAIYDLTGYPPSDYIQNNKRAFWSLTHPEDINYLNDSVHNALKQKIPWKIEYRITTKAGNVKWVSETGVGIFSVTNELQYLEGFITDISEHRGAQEQLKQAQKFEAVGQLAAGIAHEINTPTQFVGDNLQFLKGVHQDLKILFDKYDALLNQVQDSESPCPVKADLEDYKTEIDLDFLLSDVDDSLDQALEGTERIASIVKAMKVFSHPGSSEKESINLNQAIESTITVARNEWKYVAALETELDPSLPLVSCLPGEINQTVLNMIVNAAHAIEDQQAKNGDTNKGLIRVTTKYQNSKVLVTISDNGCGIPKENLQKIYDPFFTTKEVGKGTGQGLSIAYAVIRDKHDGDLEVESKPGEGTCFKITLPV